MSAKVVQAIQERFGDHVLETHAQCGDETVILDRAGIREIAEFLKHDPMMAFNMPIDCCGVDYLTYPGHVGPRFAVVYHLYSTIHKHRIRLKVYLHEEDLNTPSLRPVYRGVEWFEREVYDMYGVKFTDHPDLRRILMYPEFQGYPLRKDYPHRGYQPLVPIARLDPDNEDPKLKHVDLNPEAPHE